MRNYNTDKQMGPRFHYDFQFLLYDNKFLMAVQVLNISHPTRENAQNYWHAGQKQAG